MHEELEILKGKILALQDLLKFFAFKTMYTIYTNMDYILINLL